MKDRIKITVDNQPIGLAEQFLTFISIIFGWFVSCLLLIPITIPFLRASYVLFPIHKRITKAKLLQLMTGLSNITFCVCNFLLDIFNDIVAVVIIFIEFAIFDFNKIHFGQSNTAIGLFSNAISIRVRVISHDISALWINWKSWMSILDIYINMLNSEVISSTLFNIMLYLCHILY